MSGSFGHDESYVKLVIMDSVEKMIDIFFFFLHMPVCTKHIFQLISPSHIYFNPYCIPILIMFSYFLISVESIMKSPLPFFSMPQGDGTPLQYSCLENPMGGEPGGLPSMGSHRVGYDWSDLAAATITVNVNGLQR